jgi:hypothetical protein
VIIVDVASLNPYDEALYKTWRTIIKRIAVSSDGGHNAQRKMAAVSAALLSLLRLVISNTRTPRTLSPFRTRMPAPHGTASGVRHGHRMVDGRRANGRGWTVGSIGA